MTEESRGSDRRAQNVAIVGFILQIAAFGSLLGLSIWKQSDAAAAVARFLLIGVPIWFVLFLVFKQMRRVVAEALETAELKRAQAESANEALFDLDDESLLIEQNRLRWLVKWLLPAATVVVALILLGSHFIGWNWSLQESFSKSASDLLQKTQDPTMAMWIIVFAGFLCYLYARYALALSRMPEWRLLRAGAICMAGNAFACLGLAVTLMASATFSWAEPVFIYAVRIGLIVLGFEFMIHFVLDFYRPRTPDVVQRPSFESRLLGLLGEPGGIAKSIADAMNYQFGFEVSSTWFYQLLQRWLFPIVVFTFAVVIALTSVVIIDADEQAVIERFGRIVRSDSSVLKPGLHLKWPFPIEIVYRAPVRRISELVIGEAEEEDEHDHHAVVWTEAHDYVPEMMLLVASPVDETMTQRQNTATQDGNGADSVAVSLMMVSVPVEYRIKNMEQYLYRYQNPEKVLEGIAYQYLSDYAASVPLDELMGPGRESVNAELSRLIQEKIDELEVGIELVFVGIRGAHPPAKNNVAASFQSVVAAQTLMAATINTADGLAKMKLISATGTESRALALDAAIREKNELRSTPDTDPAQIQALEARVQDLLMGNAAEGIAPASGNTAAVIAFARASASRYIAQEVAKVSGFSANVAAYVAAPELFMRRKGLEVFKEIGPIRKYLIVGETSDVVIEYNTSEEGALDRVLADTVEAE